MAKEDGVSALVDAINENVIIGEKRGISISSETTKACALKCVPDNWKWYASWLEQQVNSVPKHTFSSLPDFEANSEYQIGRNFELVWRETWEQLISKKCNSIDDLIESLAGENILAPSDLSQTRNLIFAILGWQTMLYRPDSRSCPSTELAVADDMDGHRGNGFMCLKQSQTDWQARTGCRQELNKFLLNFGMLLPPPNYNAFGGEDDKQAFREVKTIEKTSFNAHLLSSIGHLEIVWADSLACHLELDRDSNRLFLFRYPSFCQSQVLFDESHTNCKSVIYACAASQGIRHWKPVWATEDDVENMLKETLLSYRLLFGQSKSARQYFRKLEPFDGVPAAGCDDFLTTLCGQKHYQSKVNLAERDSYHLSRDFPIYRSRLALLQHYLASKKPRSWKELWLDKRDSAHWLTFWTVLIFGGLAVILAMLQVILQIVQIKLQK